VNDIQNDTMDGTADDGVVIARLRSALDEVAAGGPCAARDPDAFGKRPDGTAASVISLRPSMADRRRERSVVAVAASIAVLVGLGGWALAQRGSPEATGQLTTVATASTSDEPEEGLASRPPGHDGPWYELRLADALPGGVVSRGTDNESSSFTQQWLVSAPNGDPGTFGVLSILVRYDASGVEGTDDPGLFRQIEATQGTAWLRNEPGDPTRADPVMVWERDDGTVWWVRQAGLIDPADSGGTALVDAVFAVEQGTFNDLLNNPDPRSEWIGTAPSNLRIEHEQNYAVGGTDAAVVLGVSNALPLERMDGTSDITGATVADNRAWRSTQADGATIVVWPIDGAWWGTLRISPLLEDRVDEVLASVVPASTDMAQPEGPRATTAP